MGVSKTCLLFALQRRLRLGVLDGSSSYRGSRLLVVTLYHFFLPCSFLLLSCCRNKSIKLFFIHSHSCRRPQTSPLAGRNHTFPHGHLILFASARNTSATNCQSAVKYKALCTFPAQLHPLPDPSIPHPQYLHILTSPILFLCFTTPFVQNNQAPAPPLATLTQSAPLRSNSYTSAAPPLAHQTVSIR